MYTDEKIMLTIEKITHGIFKAFNAFEKRVQAIQRIFENQASLAFNLLFIKTKKYKKKLVLGNNHIYTYFECLYKLVPKKKVLHF